MEANKPANPEIREGHILHEAGTERDTSNSVILAQRWRTLMDSDASVKEEDQGNKLFIGQVPMFLRKKPELESYFKPSIVSIGPLHYDQNRLKQGQQFKLQLAKLFIEEISRSKEILYKNVLQEIGSFKEFYDQQELLKKFPGNDVDLAWMFFVDGCALIQFVKIYVLNGWLAFYRMNIDRDQVERMATDLILLDNQLPSAVLKLIMGFTNQERYLSFFIGEFAKGIMKMMHFEGWAGGLILKEENHMPELIWKKFVAKKEHHMHVLVRKKFVKKEKDSFDENTEAISRQFHSVKDLQAAGISVKDLQAAGIIVEPNNSCSSLRDISFKRGILFCKLKIPSFRVTEQGKVVVINLIAFEMQPHLREDRVVTSYINFLSSLLATKEDVAVMRSAGILFNYLQNDEEVLKTFQELISTMKPYDDIFSGIKEELINYFNDSKRIKTGKWFSEAMYVYFRSPWTTIAFCSATLLLILTIIQTIFSILAYKQKK